MNRSRAVLTALAISVAGYAATPADAPGLKLTGFLQYRYEWTQTPHLLAEDAQWIPNGSGGYNYVADPGTFGYAGVDAKSETRTQVWLNLDNQFDGKTRFHASAIAEHLGGRTASTNLSIYEAYVAAKFGPAEIAVGRFLSDTGLGLICGSPFEDGLRVSAGNEWVKGQVYVTKFGQVNSKVERPNSNNGHMTFAYGDLKFMPVKGLTLSISQFKDVTSDGGANLYKATKVGFEYKYISNNIPWFTVMAEYARNDSDGAKYADTSCMLVSPASGVYVPVAVGESKTPKGYVASFKVLGAHPFMPGTGGIQLQYRNADPGLDQMGMCNPLLINNPYNWMSPSGGGIFDNYKGLEISAEATILPRMVLKAAYGFMKVKEMDAYRTLNLYNADGTPRTTDKDGYFSAQVFYIF